MRNPTEVGPDHVENWIDRFGNIKCISDQAKSNMNPIYFQNAVRDHDKNHGLTEAAIWWM